MRTTLDLNDKLLAKAQKLSKIKTTQELVNQSLEHYVRFLKRKDMLSLKGKIKWEANIDEIRQS